MRKESFLGHCRIVLGSVIVFKCEQYTEECVGEWISNQGPVVLLLPQLKQDIADNSISREVFC